jgi:hypothetical protein
VNDRGQSVSELGKVKKYLLYRSRQVPDEMGRIAQQFETWTPETIEIRRRKIEEWALPRWQIDAPSQPYIGSTDEDGVDVHEDEPAVVD